MKYECRNVFTGEVIATFSTYEKADEFIDVAYDYPDYWTVPPVTIEEVPDNADSDD